MTIIMAVAIIISTKAQSINVEVDLHTYIGDTVRLDNDICIITSKQGMI